jgi:hypothetical protein
MKGPTLSACPLCLCCVRTGPHSCCDSSRSRFVRATSVAKLLASWLARRRFRFAMPCANGLSLAVALLLPSCHFEQFFEYQESTIGGA